MNTSLANPTEVSARTGLQLIWGWAKLWVWASLVWVLATIVAMLVYAFDNHSHAHPALDVLIFHSAELALTFLLLRFQRISWKDMGLQAPNKPIRWFRYALLVVFLNVSLAGIMILGKVPSSYDTFSVSEKVLLLCVLGPVTEEMFIRGWFQTALTREGGPTRIGSAVLVSASFFAAIHLFVGLGVLGTLTTMAGAFSTGVIHAYLRQHSGSLLPAMILHSLYNVTGLFFATQIWFFFAHILTHIRQ